MPVAMAFDVEIVDELEKRCFEEFRKCIFLNVPAK